MFVSACDWRILGLWSFGKLYFVYLTSIKLETHLHLHGYLTDSTQWDIDCSNCVSHARRGEISPSNNKHALDPQCSLLIPNLRNASIRRDGVNIRDKVQEAMYMVA